MNGIAGIPIRIRTRSPRSLSQFVSSSKERKAPRLIEIRIPYIFYRISGAKRPRSSLIIASLKTEPNQDFSHISSPFDYTMTRQFRTSEPDKHIIPTNQPNSNIS